ncbi:PH domain-containing protein [Streptomyces sp. NPDC048290]|uniref:PH domain-containing protein n=1 Tax=Streptomyces sp. NPDC048290 TaxID=3155811 RepID=UPI00342E1AF2
MTSTSDRIYRSPMALVGGVLLLALALWLGIDAIVNGEGRTPWLALAALLVFVPVVTAFTLRPAVYAGEDRLRVRNPLRVIVLPWGEVASLRSGYTNEVVANSGAKFQLWAIPVSLRGRKRAARREDRRQAERAAAASGKKVRGGLFGGGGSGAGFGGVDPRVVDDGAGLAEGDRIMAELREIREAREKAAGSQGEVSVRWAYEVAGPALAGAVLFVVLLATG